ncbi:MAG: gamma-glutamyltransferase [Hyphomicrobiales bacterium]
MISTLARRLTVTLSLLLVTLTLASCGEQAKGPAMVVTANRYASEAAIEMLKQGGSAVDAAIAAQLVLGLVEPQSSGIGGGGFMLTYDRKTGKVSAIDGREKAPAAADDRQFLGPDGQPMKRGVVEIGGLSVGVPGTVALMAEAHAKSGKLPWANLFQPAIRLAEQGFDVSPRLAQAIAEAEPLKNDAMARPIYFVADAGAPGGIAPVKAGTTIRNPAYAFTLRRLAINGPRAFYEGEIADEIVSTVRSHPTNPGRMTAADLAAYTAVDRKPACRPYRAYRVCSMPPPTSGGVAALQILGMLEPYRIGNLEPNDVMAAHLLTQASRLAFADRDRYLADPDFVEVPVKGLLDHGYLRRRAALIDPGKDMGTAQPGDPGKVPELAGDPGLYEAGTSHLAIVDRDGNAVSYTTSVEQSFGANIMAAGFVLNNQLTDFSLDPMQDGKPVANRVEPGKRPRSSMTPVLVFAPDDSLFAAVGSPGGSRIIGYVTQALIGLIDWKMPMQEAVDLPHILNRNADTELEGGTAAAALAPALEAMGHKTRVRELNSGLNGIRVVKGRMDGGADKRREGVVLTYAE